MWKQASVSGVWDKRELYKYIIKKKEKTLYESW